jgi:hypothetical protein
MVKVKLVTGILIAGSRSRDCANLVYKLLKSLIEFDTSATLFYVVRCIYVVNGLI